MSLRVWLPLNKDLRNLGLSSVSAISGGTFSDNAIFCNSSSAPRFTYNINQTNKFSFAFWIKIPSTITSMNENVAIFTLACNQGNLVIYWMSYNQMKIYATSSWQMFWKTLEYDKWIHIVITNEYNNGTYTCKFYKNGVLNDTGTNSTELKLVSGDLVLGSGVNPSYGSIGYYDVRIYDHVLSAKEVKELAKGLYLHYTFANPYVENTVNLNNGTVNWYSYTQYWTIESQNISEIKLKCVRDVDYANVVALYNSSICSQLPTNTPITVSGYLYKGDIPYKTTSTTTCTYVNIPSIICWESRNDGYFRYTMTFSTAPTSDILFHAGLFGIVAPGDICYIRNMQWEIKDHATPYTPSSRTTTIIRDNSGFGNDGTINGNLQVLHGSGRYNECTKFDGNTYTTTLNLPSERLVSYSFWIYLENYIDSGIVFIGDSTSKLCFSFYGGQYLILASGDSSVPGARFNRTIIPLNKWTHVACNYKGNDHSTIELYVNGVKQTANAGEWWSNPFSRVFNIGNRNAGGIPYTGVISDLRIFTTYLSESDILDLYQTSALIDKNKNVHCYELNEEKPNMIAGAEYGLVTKQFINGLSSYIQTNCQCTLTDDGYRIYRPANKTVSTDGNTMWGGFVLRNTDNQFGLIKGHTYVLQFEIKGQTSNAVVDITWSNQCGWGGGGLMPQPSNAKIVDPVTSNYNSSEWKTFTYKWTINDDIYKTCTDSYSSFVAGNTYVSYRDFKYGFDYRDTGTLGTDLYIKNLRMYDVTTGQNVDIKKQGIVKTIEAIEYDGTTKIMSIGTIECNEFIEI